MSAPPIPLPNPDDVRNRIDALDREAHLLRRLLRLLAHLYRSETSSPPALPSDREVVTRG